MVAPLIIPDDCIYLVGIYLDGNYYIDINDVLIVLLKVCAAFWRSRDVAMLLSPERGGT